MQLIRALLLMHKAGVKKTGNQFLKSEKQSKAYVVRMKKGHQKKEVNPVVSDASTMVGI